MLPQRRTRTFKLAEGVVKGSIKSKQYLKHKIYDKIFPYYIEIKRIPDKQRYHQRFDLTKYIIENNDEPTWAYYLGFLFGGLMAGYYFALSQYDYDRRYYLYIRVPEIMQLYDDVSLYASNRAHDLQMKYIGEIPDYIKTRSDYFRFQEQIKDKLFNRKEKQEQEEKNRQELIKSASDYESALDNVDKIISSQDQQIKNIRNSD